MATPNEIPNVETLTMRLWVNGTLQQNGSTAKMIFGVHYLVHYASQFMTLEPGDFNFNWNLTGRGFGPEAAYVLKSW